MKIIILLGAPGSGKGTIAGRLSAGGGACRHISSGDLLRDAVKRQTAAGAEADGYMKRGELVPDELVARMISDLLAGAAGDCTLLLDGFPRTVAQAQMLDAAVAAGGAGLDMAILLDVPEEILTDRIAGRRVCPACGAGYHVASIPPKAEGVCDVCGAALVVRKDDNPETVRNRLAVYRVQTAPLIDFYEARGLLRRVDGAREAGLVADDLRRLLA
ncbi:MAG: adenylate kinase [Kiritimatiellaeota bacterium]|nr:adenylate kinase [Kiritimatiellota bacterium]